MAYKQVLLGDFFKFEKGLGYKGEFLAEDSDVGLIGIDSQIPGGGYKQDSEKPYSGPFKPEHVVDSGDVIVAATDITQDGSVLGSTLMVPETTSYETLIYSGDVMKAIPLQPEVFNLEFFYNLYRVEKYRKILAYGDSGTTVRRIAAENLAEQFVPLPDLPTQIAINEIISLIDQQVANNISLSKNLELLAQSIFKSWFIDFDPVHAKSRGEKPIGMDDETAALFPDSFEDSELGMIPKGWSVGTLSEICDIKQGRYLSPSQMQAKPSEENFVPVIGGNGILGYTSKSTFTFSVPLITCRGSKCGLLQWGNYPSWISNNAMAITFKHDSTDNYYLWYLFKTLAFNEVITGSAQPQITISHLGLLNVLVPKLEIVTQFRRQIAAIQEQIDSNKLMNEHLSDLRNSLLPRLISGELQIPEELLVS